MASSSSQQYLPTSGDGRQAHVNAKANANLLASADDDKDTGGSVGTMRKEKKSKSKSNKPVKKENNPLGLISTSTSPANYPQVTAPLSKPVKVIPTKLNDLETLRSASATRKATGSSSLAHDLGDYKILY